MRRVARVFGVGAAVLVLVVLPWAGARRGANDPSYFVDADQPLLIPPPPAPALAQPIGAAPFIAQQPAVVGGCGCDTVVINASNAVRDAEVRSGNATAINNSVTYISAAYAAQYENEIRVKVRQVAHAISGNVMAGQSIALNAAGPRCHNFLVRARNVLEDVEVRSGNATAQNHSTILLDPGVDPNRLDLRLHQHALAHAGTATAGQFIAASAGGNAGGCGSVKIDAANFEDDVSVRSGRAVGTNDNTVRTCASVGCAAELAALAPPSNDVHTCTADGCHRERRIAASGSPVPSGSATPAAPLALPTQTPGVIPGLFGPVLAYCPPDRLCPVPSTSPSPSPTPSVTPSPSADPSASKSPGSASPSPSPTASPTPPAKDR